MKRKYLLPIIATCMAVAVLAVGFAGWLITGHTATDTATGNFKTYDVSNKYFTVTIKETVDGTPEKIVFGRPADADNTGWLKYENVEKEDLVASFTVTIRPDVEFNPTEDATNRDVATVLGTDKVVVTLELPEAYTTAQTSGYVGGVTMAAGSISADDLTLELPASAFTITADGEDANKTATCAITVTFSWGDKTKGTATTGQNPYTYYNGPDVNYNSLDAENKEIIREAAETLLTAVHGLNAATYELSLSVEAGAGAGA